MLERQRFLVKGRTTVPRTADVLDPDTGEPVGIAEEVAGRLVAFLRHFLSKKLLPVRVEARELPDLSLVFEVRRGVGFPDVRVEVRDAQGQPVGSVGRSWVFDRHGRAFAAVSGDRAGGDLRFTTPDGQELGRVTKKWAGAGRELVTSADDYLVSLADELAEYPPAKMLLLAAALAINTIDRPGV
jgi:hypothetical protein